MIAPLIQTFTGKYFNLVDPEPEQVCIEDIAHALSNIARFTGHSEFFYSVAQHCVLGSRVIVPELARDFLMHDAAEAYLGDVSSPLKQLLPEYKVIEARVEDCIFEKFGVHFSPTIKRMDLRMLAAERKALLKDIGGEWDILKGFNPAPVHIEPWTPEVAERLFLQRANELEIL